jgi:hypothetical protein
MNLNRSYKIALVALLAAKSFLVGAQTNSAAAPLDYSSFSKFIADRNIFDPNRVPHVPYTPTHVAPTLAARQPDSFSLVGIIGYGEGRLAGVYAFFDGSSVEFRKTAQLNDSIAIFKVSAIGPDSVTLVSDTNITVLKIGQQMRDAGGGHWLSASQASARYVNSSARNSGRTGTTGSNRRRNNAGNFNRNGNGFAPSDNSQAEDPNMIIQDDTVVPDDTTTPNDTVPPDNTAVPETTPFPAPSGDPNDPLTRLMQLRAQEQQQIGQGQ